MLVFFAAVVVVVGLDVYDVVSIVYHDDGIPLALVVVDVVGVGVLIVLLLLVWWALLLLLLWRLRLWW